MDAAGGVGEHALGVGGEVERVREEDSVEGASSQCGDVVEPMEVADRRLDRRLAGQLAERARIAVDGEDAAVRSDETGEGAAEGAAPCAEVRPASAGRDRTRDQRGRFVDSDGSIIGRWW